MREVSPTAFAKALQGVRPLVLAASLTVAFGLGGCIFDDDPPSLSRPSRLSPETDLFSQSTLRTFSWTEGMLRGKRDTTLQAGWLTATRAGDSIAGADTLLRVDFSSSPGAAAEATQLGLNPARLALDAEHALDPGPSLRFPAAPAIGWRLDTTIGDLRFVRELTKTQTLRSMGKNVQCWVFAESTYWGNHPVSYGLYWMGKNGLVRHRREWNAHKPAGGVVGGTLWREIRAVVN